MSDFRFQFLWILGLSNLSYYWIFVFFVILGFLDFDLWIVGFGDLGIVGFGDFWICVWLDLFCLISGVQFVDLGISLSSDSWISMCGLWDLGIWGIVGFGNCRISGF